MALEMNNIYITDEEFEDASHDWHFVMFYLDATQVPAVFSAESHAWPDGEVKSTKLEDCMREAAERLGSLDPIAWRPVLVISLNGNIDVRESVYETVSSAHFRIEEYDLGTNSLGTQVVRKRNPFPTKQRRVVPLGGLNDNKSTGSDWLGRLVIHDNEANRDMVRRAHSDFAAQQRCVIEDMVSILTNFEQAVLYRSPYPEDA
jgi:hypothetical protein